jgi:hypothetical protein
MQKKNNSTKNLVPKIGECQCGEEGSNNMNRRTTMQIGECSNKNKNVNKIVITPKGRKQQCE